MVNMLRVSPGGLGVAIIGVPTTPGVGKSKGLFEMEDTEHGLPTHENTEDDETIGSPDGLE